MYVNQHMVQLKECSVEMTSLDSSVGFKDLCLVGEYDFLFLDFQSQWAWSIM